MRVLFCTSSFDKATTGAGTSARVIVQMTEKYPEIGFDILSEEFDRPSGNRLPCRLSALSAFPIFNYWNRAHDYARAVKLAVEQQEYDIIWFHDLWLAGRFKHEHQGVKVVGFIHDDNTLNRSNLSGVSGRTIGFRIRRILEKNAAHCVDALLTNSNYMVELMNGEYPGVPVHKLYLAGIDYEKVEFNPRTIDPCEPLRILFMKRDFRRGGLKRLLQALRLLTQFQFQLTIAGPLEGEVRKAIDPRLLQTANIKTRLAGPIDGQEEVSGLYATHDVVCVPSNSEALGLVNAEAMAYGVPVVSTRTGGIPEVLGDGKYGYFANEHTPESIAEAIRKCIVNPNETKDKVIAGREFVIRRFGLRRMHEELAGLLSGLIQTEVD